MITIETNNIIAIVKIIVSLKTVILIIDRQVMQENLDEKVQAVIDRAIENNGNVVIPQHCREKRFVPPQPPPVAVQMFTESHDQAQSSLIKAMRHSDEYHSFNLSSGKWRAQNYMDLMVGVKTWGIKGSLHLHCNAQPTIIKQITLTNFPVLKLISLQENLIQSVELLCRIQAPCLGQLNLDKNLITNISSFRKLYLPQLVRLSIPHNEIQDHSPINQMGAQYIGEISLTYGLFKSLNWIVKLQNSYFQSLDFFGTIDSPIKKMTKFKAKFPQGLIFDHQRSRSVRDVVHRGNIGRLFDRQ